MASMTSLLVVAASKLQMPNGSVVSRGTVVNRIAWDGKSIYVPPEGTVLKPDNGEKMWVPTE